MSRKSIGTVQINSKTAPDVYHMWTECAIGMCTNSDEREQIQIARDIGETMIPAHFGQLSISCVKNWKRQEELTKYSISRNGSGMELVYIQACSIRMP